MKFYTLQLDLLLPGAFYGKNLQQFRVSNELLLSSDVCNITGIYGGSEPIISRASIDVWGDNWYLVPERAPGSALLIVTFEIGASTAREHLSPQLIRLESGEDCRIESWDLETKYSGFIVEKKTVKVLNKTIFEVSFSGADLTVKKNGQLMKPDRTLV